MVWWSEKRGVRYRNIIEEGIGNREIEIWMEERSKGKDKGYLKQEGY